MPLFLLLLWGTTVCQSIAIMLLTAGIELHATTYSYAPTLVHTQLLTLASTQGEMPCEAKYGLNPAGSGSHFGAALHVVTCRKMASKKGRIDKVERVEVDFGVSKTTICYVASK